ncbi:flagellar hook-basal body protein [bacterium]|nr:flagellar hook-basal body protein [bacterium]
MINGIYTSTAGMMIQMREQETIANNIANANTSGFKRRIAVFTEQPEVDITKLEKGDEIEFHPYLEEEVIGKTGQGTIVSQIYTDYSQGATKQTGNKYDFAVMGKGYFPIQDANGEIQFTRSGEFSVNHEGYLVTQQGNKVLGMAPGGLEDGYQAFDEKGEIFVPLLPIKFDTGEIQEITFSSSGQLFIDGEESGTGLSVFRLSDKAVPLGGNLFSKGEGEVVFDGQSEIQNGYLEISNVNSVKEMVRMIQALRAYESGDRLIRTQDDTLAKLIGRMSYK